MQHAPLLMWEDESSSESVGKTHTVDKTGIVLISFEGEGGGR